MRASTFAEILEHLVGRERRQVAAYLLQHPEAAAPARALLAVGRDALDAPRPGARARRRVIALFKRPADRAPGLLRIVLDSVLRAAPAMRGQSTASGRFLRLVGEVTLELQVTPRANGVELRGQVDPAQSGRDVVWEVGARSRRVRIADDGTFLFRSLPRGPCTLRIGRICSEEIDL